MHKFALSALILLTASVTTTGCLPYTAKMKRKHHGVDMAKLEMAERNGNTEEVRKTCRKPPVHSAPLSIPFKNKKAGQEACDYLKADFDRVVDSGTANAKKAGGGVCLVSLALLWQGTDHGKDALKWETDEARLPRFSPTAESCIAQMEEWASAKQHTRVFASLLGKFAKAQSPALTPEQRERTQTLWSTALAESERLYLQASSEAGDARPRAAALFMAAAAISADASGETGRNQELMTKARALLDATKGKGKMTVGMSGSGLASELVQLVTKKSSSDSSMSVGSRGDLMLALELATPDISTGSRDVSRSASIEVPGPDKPNPEYVRKEAKCEDHRGWASKYQDTCSRRNDSSCDQAQDRQEDVEDCEEELAKIKPTVPGTTTEEIPYDAVEYYGRAKGSLSIRVEGERPRTESISASISRDQHASVPRANLSASSASPVSKSAAQDAYISDAATKIRSLLRDRASQRAAALLTTAKGSESTSQSAEDFVLYMQLGGRRLEQADIQFIGTHIGVPLHETAKALFGN